jgi:hypothetical protein
MSSNSPKQGGSASPISRQEGSFKRPSISPIQKAGSPNEKSQKSTLLRQTHEKQDFSDYLPKIVFTGDCS